MRYSLFNRYRKHYQRTPIGKWLSFFLIFTGLFLAILAIPYAVRADIGEIYTCPDNYPEGPAFDQHVEQEELLNGTFSLDEILDIGEKLFIVDFNTCDGRGRPAATGGGDKRDPQGQPNFLRTSAPDSNSCAGCHNEPRAGGGGDFVANVFVLAQTLDPVVESVNGEFSNERNTLGMFGSGPIEMLSREITTDLLAIRDAAIAEASSTNETVTVALESKGINYGNLIVAPDGTLDFSEVEGLDHDLIIKPFHQVGRVVSLREFTNNAMNHHHGMQTEERFDLNPNKGVDYDEDGVARELTIGDVTAVTLWQAALATPGRMLPADKAEQEVVDHGEEMFAAIGCTSCHMPELMLNDKMYIEPNPYNPDGNWRDSTQTVSFDMTSQGLDQRVENVGDQYVVRAYTDLKRHDLCDDAGEPDAIRHYCNEQLTQGRPDQDDHSGTEYFLTAKLWTVGNSSPFGHRGDLTTITEAILVHGGEGRESRDAFAALETADQAAVVSFLKTLQILPEGKELVMVEGQEPMSPSPYVGLPIGTTILASVVAAIIGATVVFLLMRRRQSAMA